jgi:membrane associated rhomboid family serine protease
MPSESSYPRETAAERAAASLMWLISMIIAAFLIQLVVTASWFRIGIFLPHHFGVSIAALQEFRFWTLGTHPLLHRTDNFLHIITVIAGLVLLGRELLPMLGARRFIGLFFGASAAGALTWAAVNWQTGGGLLGGMAGIYGLFALFACLNPNLELRFLLFFFLPISLKPRALAWALVTFDLCGSIYFEFTPAVAPFAYAPSAHLGGMLTGLIFYQLGYSERSLFYIGRAALTRALNPPPNVSPIANSADFSPPNSHDLRVEVDRILDKINSSGLASLTSAEKRLLDEAKNFAPRG